MLSLSVFTMTVYRKIASYIFKPGYLRFSSSRATLELLSEVKSIVPSLTCDLHKGQAGRIAVIGGCLEYSGAPYFSAITALKVGADLSHVFCTAGAGSVIKSYSPDLIVHPILDHVDAVSEISKWLHRFHCIVIGPGLGRDSAILSTVNKLILKSKEYKIPLVIDADGLYLVTDEPGVVKGNSNIILTPNVVEFSRLFQKVTGKEYDSNEGSFDQLMTLCNELGNVTIVQKGQVDLISDGRDVLSCDLEGSLRRCGGQGDLLSGSMGLFFFWAKLHTMSERGVQPQSPSVVAAFAACALIRECSRRAFAEHRRCMTASDLIPHIQGSFEHLFS